MGVAATMKTAVLLCALLGAVFAIDDFAKKQSDVLNMLDRVHDHTHHDDIAALAHDYYPGDHAANYKDFEAVKHWLSSFHGNHWIERDHHFNLFDANHRAEAIEMFEVFMNAKTYEDFHDTACWARERANQLLFTYAYCVTILNRADTSAIQLPPMYEINPHYFTTTDVIREAYSAKMKQTPKTIKMKFTGTPVNREQWVAYYGEDVGLNNHHFHWHADFPFWWKPEYENHKDRKGELFFYAHHMLTARFDHERLSNFLPMVKPLHWDEPIQEGFQPHTTYKTEGEFPFRPDDMEFHDLPAVTVANMKEMEHRVMEAIDLGFIVDDHGERININNTNGINVLGEIIESSLDSKNREYYGSLHNLAHVMLAHVSDPEGKFDLPPGVMSHFETATRDPSFFRLHKYMDNIFKKHKDSLPPYTHDEVDFPGVEVTGLKVTGGSAHANELHTFFDDFTFDLTNALDTSKDVPHVDIKAEVQRLNHEPFTYNIHVKSDGSHTGVVRIFLSPKYSYYGTELTLDQKRWLAVEMDRFTVELHAGDNDIKRKSTQSSATIPDRLGFQEIRDALAQGELHHEEMKRHCGHPHRMLLPKGHIKGMEFELFVMVSDFEKDKAMEHDHKANVGDSLSYCGVLNGHNPDGRPMGFPFDRHHLEHNDMTKNMKTATITIKHMQHHDD